MQVGPELALRQEIPTSSLHTHSLATRGFFMTALFFLYKAARFIQIPTTCKQFWGMWRSHSTTCPESWPPLRGETASSPCPRSLRDPEHSKAWTAVSPLQPLSLSLPSMALPPNKGLTTSRANGVPTKVNVKTTGARVYSSFWKSRVTTIIKKGEGQLWDSYSALGGPGGTKTELTHIFTPFLFLYSPKEFHNICQMPLPHISVHRDTFLFLPQLLWSMMTAWPYGVPHSAPSSSIQHIWIVFTPHLSDSQTWPHREPSFYWPVPPRVLHWEYTQGGG